MNSLEIMEEKRQHYNKVKRAWRTANPKRIKEYEKRRKRNKEQRAAQQKIWRVANPDKCREYERRRNLSIGGLGDSIEGVKKALAYLERAEI